MLVWFDLGLVQLENRYKFFLIFSHLFARFDGMTDSMTTTTTTTPHHSRHQISVEIEENQQILSLFINDYDDYDDEETNERTNQRRY